MNVTAIHTKKIQPNDDLFALLDKHIPTVKERDIIVITSKIVSICEGRTVKNDESVDKDTLIRRESEYYIDDPALSRYHVTLSINRGVLIANAGIDESNANGHFVLWPKNPDTSAANIWTYLRTKHGVNELGVIITDSKLTPLRWGTTGFGLAYCGFNPLKDYIGTPDIFGRYLRVTKANIIDGLAASAVVVMGEGDEQTPIAIISDVPFVSFQNRPPTTQELQDVKIDKIDDMYAPLVNSPRWKPGH